MMRSSALAAVAAGLLFSTLAGAEPIALRGEEGVRDLCQALRPVERVSFPGDAAQRAKARVEYEKERERLRRAEFALELLWGAFTVAEWDAAQEVATVSTERPFRAFDGALTFFDADRDEIDLEALEGASDALQTALAKGAATLALTFRPAEEEGSPCVIGKARTYALAVDLLAAELRANGKALARASGEGFEPRPATQGTPAVELKAAPAQDCADCRQEVVVSVQKTRPLVEKCYLEALSKKPGLDGSLVLGLEVAKDGKVQVTTVVVDSLQDADALACVKQAVGTARSSARGGRGMVIVQLERR